MLQASESEVGKGLPKADGPFVRGFEAALKSFNVQRQPYYSGTFVGNHVHRALKFTNRMYYVEVYCFIHHH